MIGFEYDEVDVHSVAADLKEFHKKPDEKFVVYADFSNVLATNEYLASGIVSVTDKNGDAVTDVTGRDQIIGDDSEKLAVVVMDGTADYSPYKMSFIVLTSRKLVWQLTVLMRVL